jgi:hypothetical protein
MGPRYFRRTTLRSLSLDMYEDVETSEGQLSGSCNRALPCRAAGLRSVSIISLPDAFAMLGSVRIPQQLHLEGLSAADLSDEHLAVLAGLRSLRRLSFARDCGS